MAAESEQGPLRVGTKFLNYAIQGLIGKGGHAWVYDGHNEFLDHHVAIKILHRPGGVTRDMLRRGQAEAKLLFRLKHENIVDVVDAGMTDEGLLYIVMERLRGRSLREVLGERGRLPVGAALTMFHAIAEGMGAAHETKTIHRDLKPENIFVLSDGTPKILDFGIAKITDAAGWTTEKDIIHGTLLYMSPEQLEGLSATVRSDVYSLGLVLFETILGRHPCLVENANPTVQELARIQAGVSPPRLDELDPAIPRHVGRLVERMIAKRPDQRIASMGDLADALQESIRRWIAEPKPEPRAVAGRPGVPNEPRDTEPVEPRTFLSTSDTLAPASRGARPPRAPTEPYHLDPAAQAGAHAPTRTAQAAGGRERRMTRLAAGAGAVIGGAVSAVLMTQLASTEEPETRAVERDMPVPAQVASAVRSPDPLMVTVPAPPAAAEKASTAPLLGRSVASAEIAMAAKLERPVAVASTPTHAGAAPARAPSTAKARASAKPAATSPSPNLPKSGLDEAERDPSNQVSLKREAWIQ